MDGQAVSGGGGGGCSGFALGCVDGRAVPVRGGS